MLNTANQLKTSFDQLTFQSPIIPIILNFSAKPFIDIEDLKNSLISQTYSTVRWYESISYMIEKGTNLFLEIGNGNTLSNLLLDGQGNTFNSKVTNKWLPWIHG